MHQERVWLLVDMVNRYGIARQRGRRRSRDADQLGLVSVAQVRRDL